MKILIMGLPGSGKTWLAERLQKHLNCAWYNADEIRKMANDWDFSDDARRRQAFRMACIANAEKAFDRVVICDFVCPTKNTRDIFDANITLWLDTIKESRFEDTNKVFEEPTEFDYLIENFMSDKEIKQLADSLRKTYDV
jgi:adenylylsulfate kinase